MQFKKSTQLVLLTLLMVVGANTLVITNTAQPAAGHTGAPGENTCTAAGCHNGTANSTSLIVLNTAPSGQLATGYTPGTDYNIFINVQDLATPATSQPKDGFQVTVLDSNNNFAGAFTVTNANSTSKTTTFGREYIGHKNATSTSAWTFRWTAPAVGTGPVRFYVAANRSNSNGSDSGDNIYNQSFTFSESAVNPCTNFNAFISTPGAANTFCNGQSLELTASATGISGAATYAWSNGATTAATTVTTSDTYTVTVSNNGCTSTASLAVTSIATGVAAFTVSVNENTVTINNNSTGVVGNYTWNFGDGTEFADNSAAFVYTYDSVGFYTISLNYTDACGLNQTATQQFTINIISSAGQPSLADVLSVYPNPFGSTASININGYNGAKVLFTLVDVTGKVVMRETGIAGTPLVINRSGLQSGIYFYSILVKGETAQGKLLVD